MHLPKPAIFLLLPQAFIALAVPLAAGDLAVVGRNTALFNTFATPSQWARYALYDTAPVKRSLLSVAAVPQSPLAEHISIGHFGSIGAPALSSHKGLFTTDLRAAVGCAVVGKSTSTGHEQRFLVHLPQAPGSGGASETWNGFVDAVKAARLRSDDIRVVVRVPDLGRDLPSRADGAPWDWAGEDERLASMVRSEMQVLARMNFGVPATVIKSPMGAVYRGQRDAGTMEVSGRAGGGTRVYVDGKVVA